MEKRGSAFSKKIFLLIAILLAIGGIFSYGYRSSFGMSGLSIFSLMERARDIPNSAMLFFVGMLFFLIAFFVTIFIKEKMVSEKDVNKLNVGPRYGKYKTDLDVLYEVLKEQKKIKIKVIAKAFNVDKEKAMGWSKILESGNLGTIEYPGLMEGPELRLVEKEAI